MAYPSRNSSTYSSPGKNSSVSTNEDIGGQYFLLIDDTFVLLIENTFKLLIETPGGNWNYQAKS